MNIVISRKEAELILVALGTMNDNLGNIDPEMSERLTRLHGYVYEQYMI